VKHVNILAILCVLGFCSSGFAEENWEQAEGIHEIDMRAVSISPFNNGIYASTGKVLYGSDDQGDSWSVVFSCQGQDNDINFTGISEKGVFVCAKADVFKSEDGKSDWRRIFEEDAAHIAFSKDRRIFLGAKKGLFISADNGISWQKDKGEIGSNSIGWIEFTHDLIFVAAEKGVYRNAGHGWKRVFITARGEAEYDSDITDEDIRAIKPVNSVTVYKNNIFLATDSGIFFSEDQGVNWKEFTNTGLISLKVKKLICKNGLYAATSKGVFMFFEHEKLWKPLYKGMPTKDICDIAIGTDGYLWAATKTGLYKTKITIK
jgi:hypothetical protein